PTITKSTDSLTTRSPPRRISDPGTTPPPSTRSNSPMPVDSRTLCDISTSAYSLAVDDVENCEKRLVGGVPAGDSARSSTSEFHAPHSVQRPIHLGACAPHSWQTKTTLGDFTRQLPIVYRSNSQLPTHAGPWELEPR